MSDTKGDQLGTKLWTWMLDFLIATQFIINLSEFYAWQQAMCLPHSCRGAHPVRCGLWRDCHQDLRSLVVMPCAQLHLQLRCLHLEGSKSPLLTPLYCEEEGDTWRDVFATVIQILGLCTSHPFFPFPLPRVLMTTGAFWSSLRKSWSYACHDPPSPWLVLVHGENWTEGSWHSLHLAFAYDILRNDERLNYYSAALMDCSNTWNSSFFQLSSTCNNSPPKDYSGIQDVGAIPSGTWVSKVTMKQRE